MKKVIFVLIIFLTLALTGTAYSGAWEDGLAAAQRGDYEEALLFWRPLADQGDADAQYNIGVIYDNGYGIPEDDVEAVRWYRKAAEQGKADAQFDLAVKYQIGEGVLQNTSSAVDWYYKAGMSLIETGNRERALTVYDRINEISPGNVLGEKLKEALNP